MYTCGIGLDQDTGIYADIRDEGVDLKVRRWHALGVDKKLGGKL